LVQLVLLVVLLIICWNFCCCLLLADRLVNDNLQAPTFDLKLLSKSKLSIYSYMAWSEGRQPLVRCTAFIK